MRGPIYIERENSDGDRRIVETIDTEGLPHATDIRAHVRERCDVAIAAPDAYRVRAVRYTYDGTETVVRWVVA